MACTKCASLGSGPAFLQPVQSTRPRPASSLGQPPVQGDMSSVAAAAAATASATASAVLAVAGAVSLGAASGRRRAAKLPKVVRLQGAQNMPSPTLEINYYELDAVEAPRILSAIRLAIKMASPIVKESTSPEERLLKLLSEPSVQSLLTTVSRLPVFSKEMALAFKEPFLFFFFSTCVMVALVPQHSQTFRPVEACVGHGLPSCVVRVLRCLARSDRSSTYTAPIPLRNVGTWLMASDDLDLLLALKQLKYFWNLPQSQLAILLEVMARQLEGPSQAAPFQEFLRVLTQTPNHAKNIKHLNDQLPAEVKAEYLRNADYLETADAHAVYPTSIYRQCDGFTLATKDASTIEAVMSTTLTTTIKIARKVLEPSNHLLYNIYKPLGRCVAVVDDKVDAIYGKELDAYFAGHGIEFKKIVSSGNEADKDIRDVERILVSLKKVGLADPQSKKMAPPDDRFVVTPTDLMISTLTKSQNMAAVGEVVRMLDGVDGMVVKYSTQPSEALRNISVQTAKTNPNWAEMEKKGATSKLLEAGRDGESFCNVGFCFHFPDYSCPLLIAEMISGQAEGQLLQLLVKFGRVKKVLDIGTFTGYSSLAMAEALPEDGRVVTLERQEEAAKMAAENWASSPHVGKIESRVGEAQALLQALASQGESFDLVFLDVDKPGYFALYQTLMETGLLRVGGLLAVDNTMYKGEELTREQLSVNGEGARALNAGLLADDRVLQVMLPLRDGLTLAFRQH
ncbi:unnamed protein product [Polarella glacialis]|uniref:Caffeoyl-CoA O-methyltransferase n=1 Tax=Polarella glacialis TaxID=89957 RepID=A0A813D4T6_POLGL|nr:unnamed protein product [Polarella glacialis]